MELTQSEIDHLDHLKEQDLFTRLEALERAVLILSRPSSEIDKIVDSRPVSIDLGQMEIERFIKDSESTVAPPPSSKTIKIIKGLDLEALWKECPDKVTLLDMVKIRIYANKASAHRQAYRGFCPRLETEPNGNRGTRYATREEFFRWLRELRAK